MTILEQLQQLYEDYAAQAKSAKEKSSYFATVFNTGNDYRNHPCHDQFYEKLGALVAEFAEGNPSAEEAEPVLQWLLLMAAAHKEEPTYWYLYAAHNFAMPLIKLAEPAACARLLEQYGKVYPRVERMPVQEKIYKALTKRAKKG